jgi:hypothetical protein
MSPEHVSLECLWEYHRDALALSLDQFTHICACDDCLAMLGVCEMSKTMKQAARLNEERLEKH